MLCRHGWTMHEHWPARILSYCWWAISVIWRRHVPSHSLRQATLPRRMNWFSWKRAPKPATTWKKHFCDAPKVFWPKLKPANWIQNAPAAEYSLAMQHSEIFNSNREIHREQIRLIADVDYNKLGIRNLNWILTEKTMQKIRKILKFIKENMKTNALKTCWVSKFDSAIFRGEKMEIFKIFSLFEVNLFFLICFKTVRKKNMYFVWSDGSNRSKNSLIQVVRV